MLKYNIPFQIFFKSKCSPSSGDIKTFTIYKQVDSEAYVGPYMARNVGPYMARNVYVTRLGHIRPNSSQMSVCAIYVSTF